MKAKLIDVGRGKVNKQVTIKTADDLMDEVCKHLMSSEVDIEFNDEKNPQMGTVIVGGMRPVGKVELLDCKLVNGELLSIEYESKIKVAKERKIEDNF